MKLGACVRGLHGKLLLSPSSKMGNSGNFKCAVFGTDKHRGAWGIIMGFMYNRFIKSFQRDVWRDGTSVWHGDVKVERDVGAGLSKLGFPFHKNK